MKRGLIVMLVCACGQRPDSIEPSEAQQLPAHTEITLDQGLKTRRRMVPPEVFLRAYMSWFGGLAPLDVVKRARGNDLFEQWVDYLVALGLPDYQLDTPRVTQSNTIMLAALGRLGEALCVRSAEHDLHARTPLDQRVVFAFDPMGDPTLAEFTPRFDVLHRTFLGYPASLAPRDRIERFLGLYRQVAANHASNPKLSPDELGWVAVCTALVQHPETGLY
jgi:hypothetical protein